jgi:hypothetical protein
VTLFDQHGQPIDDDARAEAEILVAVTAEMLTLEAEGEPMLVEFNPVSVFQLAGLLQLALRHPDVQASNRETAQRFLVSAREYFAESPAVLRVLDMGDDPTQDR